ncbi:MAG TPA: DUF3429 family protein [Steroidobacteraceae bacterium]|nr:DUF3429 family protein [Steroidobacteraceae bacterium]
MTTSESSSSSARSRLSEAAELTAYAGIIPFVLCPLGMAFLPRYAERELAQEVALAYGAAVLAAAGAVHWGLALAGRISWRAQRIAGCTLPALAGAASVVLSGQRGLALLVVASGIFWLYEHRAVANELPEDYLKLRRNLTLAGCSLLAFTMILSDTVGLS